MHVGRKQFLVLAASIVACSGGQISLDGPITVAAPSELEPAEGGEPLAPAPAEVASPAVAAAHGPEAELLNKCRALEPPPGPHCEGFLDTKADCEGYVTALRPEAAVRATSCLSRRSGKASICRPQALEECFSAAVRGTSADRSAFGRCDRLVRDCKAAGVARDLSQNTCARAFAAIKPELESALVACISEGCGVGSCIWQLADR